VQYQQKSQDTHESELAVILLHGHAMLFLRIGTQVKGDDVSVASKTAQHGMIKIQILHAPHDESNSLLQQMVACLFM
jgi:hypothetical protein